MTKTLINSPGIEKEPNFPPVETLMSVQFSACIANLNFSQEIKFKSQVRSHNNHLNVSATKVNYFSTMSPEYYLGGGGEHVDDEGEVEEEDLESLSRGLDQEAREGEGGKNFELNSSSVSSFSPASYASYHPETGQCRNIVLEARHAVHNLDPPPH